MREAPQHRLDRIADRFAQIAIVINERKPEAALSAMLEETHTLCQGAAAEGSGDIASLLSNLTKALETWRQVWPRLGAQQEFRLAVAREATLWSKRLHALTKDVRAADNGGGTRGA